MRVPVYVMCAALIAAVKTDKSALFSGGGLNEPPEGDAGQARDGPPAAYGLELLLPRLLYAKYKQRLDSTSNNYNGAVPSRQWVPFNPYPYTTSLDANNYVDDDPQQPQEQQLPQMQMYPDERIKREGKSPSLSIVNSLDVLRDRLLFEISRKKAKEGANRNRCMLGMIGKRIPLNSRECKKSFFKK